MIEVISITSRLASFFGSKAKGGLECGPSGVLHGREEQRTREKKPSELTDDSGSVMYLEKEIARDHACNLIACF